MVKTGRCCSREMAVVVAVCAERMRRSHPLSDNDRRGGRHHHHHHFHQFVSKDNGRVKGYNRRAELLDYAKHLRASAQSADASASVPSHPFSHIKQPSTVQISTADRKRNHSSPPPTCLHKWECVIQCFLRSKTALNISKNKGKKNQKNSASAATEMKALVKSVRVQKKGNFLSKLLRKLKKHR